MMLTTHILVPGCECVGLRHMKKAIVLRGDRIAKQEFKHFLKSSSRCKWRLISTENYRLRSRLQYLLNTGTSDFK